MDPTEGLYTVLCWRGPARYCVKSGARLAYCAEDVDGKLVAAAGCWYWL